MNDVYRDLRDRHLLLPAVVLLVALIAVPVLLRKPAEEPVVAPAVATADTSAVTSAVLVDDSVPVREYKKRLSQLKSKNPFAVNIEVESSGSGAGGGAGGDEGGDTGATVSPTPTDVTGAEATSPSAPPTDPTDTSTDVSTGAPADTSSPDTSDDSTDTTEPEIRFLAGRVDITMGPLGKAREYDNVKYLTFLPDDAKPLATFVGLTESGAGKEAVFAISSLVEVGDGDGSCSPHKPDPCQFLTLKAGEQRYLKYDGKAYRLKVRDTHLVSIQDPREQNSEGDDSATDSTTDGGDDKPGGQTP